MMKLFKFLFTLLLAVMTAPAGKAAVGDVVASGTCGTGVTWTLTENGEKACITVDSKLKVYDGVTLTISGTGAVTDRNYRSVTGLFGYNNTPSYNFITNVIVGEGVTSLPIQAFSEFYSMRRISLPSTLTTIGTIAFSNCDALKSIVIPDGVTQIQQRTFQGCDSLRSVSLGKGVTNIGNYAFMDCIRLMTLRMTRYEPDDENPITSFLSMHPSPFSGCVSLASIVVPEAGKTRYLQYEYNGETRYTFWDATNFKDESNNNVYFRELIRTDHETLFAAGTTNEWTEWADKFNHAAPRGAEVYTVGGLDGRTVRLNRITATVTLPEAEREAAGDDGVRALIPAFVPVLIKRPGGTLTEDLKMTFVMGGELAPENGWYSSTNGSLWGTSGIYNNEAVGWGYIPSVVPDIMASIPYGYRTTTYTIRTKADEPGGIADFLYAPFREGSVWGNADKNSKLQGRTNAFSTDAHSYFKLDGDQFRFIPNSEAEDCIVPHHCTLMIPAEYLGGDLTSPLSLSVNERTEVALADDADNTAAIAAAVSTTSNRVTLSGRTLYTDGDWNTLCLPFDVDFGTNTDFFFSFLVNNTCDAVVMELDTEGTYDGDKQTGFDATNGTLYLYFRRVYAIEAGKPYIVKWNSRQGYISNPVFYDTTTSTDTPTAVTSTDGKVQFLGTYAPINFTSGDKSILFMGGENTLYYPEAGARINAFRAYFQLSGITACDINPNNVRMNFADGDEAGGISLTPGLSPKDEGSDYWYTIDGRKLSGKPSQPGVYINKGKKVVIK